MIFAGRNSTAKALVARFRKVIRSGTNDIKKPFARFRQNDARPATNFARQIDRLEEIQVLSKGEITL